jgi:hypothetical protein
MRKIKFILLAAVVSLAGCATEYYTYSGSPVIQGHGGASKRVDGIDLWVIGTPPRKFQVIGYIEDSRPGGPIPMAARDGQLAAKVRAAGGDGLIMSSDASRYIGTFTTANASAYTSGNVNFAGNGANFNANTNANANSVSMPIYRRDSRYFVIKYVE